MAVKPKPRPKDIPVGNVKRKSGAITESIRPKTLEKRPRELAKEFGDLEYRADLDTQLSWNPISRLGFDPDVHKIIKPPTAFYAQKAGPGVKEELIKQGYSPEDAEKIKTDRVITGSDLSISPIISHEFTHRGFNILRNKMNQDPEAFEEKYGKQARKILEFTSKGDLKSDFEEYYVELFDDLDTRFNSSSLRAAGAGGEYESFPRDDLRRTVQSSKIGPNFPLDADIPKKYRDTRIRQIKTFQDNVEKYRKKGKLGGLAQGINQDINNGILGLMDAAQDILTEQGEPPKAKRKSLSFFEKLGKMIGFNKGGSIMNEQMQMAFMNEGGLKDDGMNKDPVSGNEVPSGSMAKEVRDDIPAQLSEGEYVVPADVVRYYGVKFFEDLRERAKMGLQEMEMNGRIGGEPVPAGGPINNEELSPQEMQAIQEMMGMAEGGTVNMYKQQQQLYTAPNPAIGNSVQMNQGGQVSGYDEAGTVTANPATSASVEQDMLQAGATAQQRNFGGFGLGATIFPSAETGKTILETMAEPIPQTITLYSPDYLTDNQTITVTLPTQDALYQEKIAAGWTTVPPVAVAPSSGGGGGGGGGDDPDPKDPNAWAKGLTAGNSMEWVKANLSGQKTGGGFLNNINLAQNYARSAALANIAEAQGNTALANQIRGEMKTVYDNSQFIRMMPGEWIDGDQIQGKLGDTIDLSGKTTTSNLTSSSSIQTKNVDELRAKVEKKKKSKASLARAKATAIASEAKRTGKSIAQIGREKAPSGVETASDKAAKDAGATRGSGGEFGMNKGGLMTKGKKKK